MLMRPMGIISTLLVYSVPHLLEDLGGLIQAFHVSLHVPQVRNGFRLNLLVAGI